MYLHEGQILPRLVAVVAEVAVAAAEEVVVAVAGMDARK